MRLHKDSCGPRQDVHGSLLASQKREPAQMSINRRVGEGNVVCPHSGRYSAAKGMNYRSRSISQKHFAEQRKPDTEEHIPYDSGQGREGQSVVLRSHSPWEGPHHQTWVEVTRVHGQCECRRQRGPGARLLVEAGSSSGTLCISVSSMGAFRSSTFSPSLGTVSLFILSVLISM